MLVRLVLITLSSAALAQANFGESPFSFSVESTSISVVDGESADVFSAELRGGIPLLRNEQLVSALSLSHERQYFNGWEQFDELAATKVSLFLLYRFLPDWRFMALSSVSSQHEAGVNISDAVTYSGIYGVWNEGNDRLLWGAGVGYSTSLYESASIFPIIYLDWQLADQWLLTTRPTPGTRFGPGASLYYEHSDRVGLYLGARYISEEFALQGGNHYSYSTARAFGTLQYSWEAGFSVNLTLGVNFAGSIEMSDERESRDLDPSVFIALNCSWDF